MDFIFIEELRVKAWVGVYEREKTGQQTVELNLTFGVPDAAAEHDDIADTIDYAVVTQRIREELAQRHSIARCHLREFSRCERIDRARIRGAGIRQVARHGVHEECQKTVVHEMKNHPVEYRSGAIYRICRYEPYEGLGREPLKIKVKQSEEYPAQEN